ncbi:alkylation response protein AidB-like acyl-CoA dehydrogenase [Amycolatopsis bartoniae]|uniref:Acyl-CoA dehydrogenase n=1 Tax=Amycolatopsis bartoniae TaxID=941986 RepID=A0A8H9IMP0_9PSEU|nr:acyl-CoA dehydrogenase family protein [Amycolatopsis bartoniae]MBB2939926.1 alkylation response protein AidB-like acyl-CoA dehydrogenase [Amycolatopsis bartoniae]TVT08290.1 acyl-CoA dehydrogenase [Amycolatopsis bartoniae]GHF35649.1 acyl-CoA dehydrogenase [Amycolatopsis bartoniae]
MNLEYDDLERQLAQSVREFCDDRFDRGTLRKFADGGERPSKAFWKQAADQGWFSLRVPEEAGGAGLSMVHASLLFLEIGRALVTGPLLWTHLAATHLREDKYAGAADGTLVVAGAVRVEGRPLLVEDLDVADVVLVVAGDEVVAAPAAQLKAKPRKSFDPTRTLSEITGLGTAERAGGPELARALRLEGAGLTAAAAAGGAAAVTGLAVEHAKARTQFGRPLGSFQAVKHLCAEMSVAAHAAESSALWAALHAAENGLESSAQEIHMAWLVATKRFLANSRTAVQVFGALGYTWEADVHLYLKRAHALSTSFGSAPQVALGIGQSLLAAGGTA